MYTTDFVKFFQNEARRVLLRVIDLAIEEDGRDLTSDGLFGPGELVEATVRAKEDCVVAGLPLAGIILERCAAAFSPSAPFTVLLQLTEGACARKGDTLLRIQGQASLVLKSERIILNFMTHLSGVATLTKTYVAAMGNTKTRLLDTRKTMPGMRYLEKYAVCLGGGFNHRLNLEDMLMLKDNHIDRAGSITAAVAKLRSKYSPCPPIEAECRTLEEVEEAVGIKVDRIMLDNMDKDSMAMALRMIPKDIESEISGGVSLENIKEFAALGADFISVGRITHSAPSVDLSMTVKPVQTTPGHPRLHANIIGGIGDSPLDSEAERERIDAARNKLGDDVIIFAHHYQNDHVVRHADIVGDSLELARKVAALKAKHIVFCGVYFMAESAALLAQTGQEVYIPDPAADCVMSEMAPASLVAEALERLNAGNRKVVPVAYVNTSAAVKAVCGRFDGTVCTSANAPKILSWALQQGDAVLFLPDKNLAMNTADQLGMPAATRLVLDIRKKGQLISPEAAADHTLLMWPGCCAIHHGFKAKQIEEARKAYVDARVVVHPECPPSVVQAADSAGSTSHIIRYVAEAPKGATVIVGTEINLVNRLAKQYAGEKTILPLAEIGCSNMAKVTQAKLAALLEGIASGKSPLAPVKVAMDEAEPARLALQRMLDASA